MSDYYNTTKEITKLYSLLQDELSKDIFWGRMRCDVEHTTKCPFHLCASAGLFNRSEIQLFTDLKDFIFELQSKNNRVLLYGAGKGSVFWESLFSSCGCHFDGYCDKKYNNFPNGAGVKPVLSPETLLNDIESTYVLITSVNFYDEIYNNLIQMGFPENHILKPPFNAKEIQSRIPKDQYFVFPDLYKKGTAFVDGGCYDGNDCFMFADFCNGEYSKIFAFEPDPENYKKCKYNLDKLNRTEVFQAGLGGRTTSHLFLNSGTTASRIVNTKDATKTTIFDDLLDDKNSYIETIQILSLDDLTQNETVGFIKLDVEGAEMDALKGAEQTILRDKPFLAVCVYHKTGDMLTIMDYLNNLKLGYRFWLRHYTLSGADTVLFGSSEA